MFPPNRFAPAEEWRYVAMLTCARIATLISQWTALYPSMEFKKDLIVFDKVDNVLVKDLCRDVMSTLTY